jgi:hypothetical protein
MSSPALRRTFRDELSASQLSALKLAERVGFVLPLIPKDFGSSRFVTSPKSYQKWGKSPVRNVAEIEDKKDVPMVWVGGGVSEVQEAFVTSLAGSLSSTFNVRSCIPTIQPTSVSPHR